MDGGGLVRAALSPAEVVRELERLTDLRTAGHIDDTEHWMLKAAILRKM